MAQKILDKVNEMNFSTGRDCILAAGVFAALPKDITAPIAAFGVLAAGIYLFGEKKD